MSEDKNNEAVPEIPTTDNYEAPAVEEIVTREGLEREVAYAGIVGSNIPR